MKGAKCTNQKWNASYNAHDKSFTAGSHHRTAGHQGCMHSGATTRRKHTVAVVVHVAVDQTFGSDTYKGKDRVQWQEPRQCIVVTVVAQLPSLMINMEGMAE